MPTKKKSKRKARVAKQLPKVAWKISLVTKRKHPEEQRLNWYAKWSARYSEGQCSKIMGVSIHTIRRYYQTAVEAKDTMKYADLIEKDAELGLSTKACARKYGIGDKDKVFNTGCWERGRAKAAQKAMTVVWDALKGNDVKEAQLALKLAGILDPEGLNEKRVVAESMQTDGIKDQSQSVIIIRNPGEGGERESTVVTLSDEVDTSTPPDIAEQMNLKSES